jgi:hypothetical protein
MTRFAPSSGRRQMSSQRAPDTTAEVEFVKDVRVFVRGEQLPLLARVLGSVALHHSVPRGRVPCLLWHGGLSMKQIQKQMACFSKK